MKSKTGSIIAIIFLSLLACGLIFAMYIGIKHVSLSDLPSFSLIHKESQRLALDKEFDFKDTKRIEIEGDSSNISFIHGDHEDRVDVKIFADESKIVRAEKDSGALSISTKSSCRGFCFGQSTDRIEITLPETYENDFVIKTDAGNISSSEFSKAAFDIESDSSTISIPAAKRISINSDAGNIEIGSVEYISIESDAGDIRINECYGELQIQSDAGKIEIDELQLSKNSSIKADAGKVKINNSGNVFVNARGDFSKFNIQNNNRNSDIELLIEIDAGKVDIN